MMPLIKSFILFRQLCPNNCGVTVALIQLLFSYMPGDYTWLQRERGGAGVLDRGVSEPRIQHKFVSFQFLFLSAMFAGEGKGFCFILDLFSGFCFPEPCIDAVGVSLVKWVHLFLAEKCRSWATGRSVEGTGISVAFICRQTMSYSELTLISIFFLLPIPSHPWTKPKAGVCVALNPLSQAGTWQLGSGVHWGELFHPSLCLEHVFLLAFFPAVSLVTLV